ncbi:MAG: hypothetical protein PSV17_03285 [Methylotenera sp.]|uniref:LPD7 domain-containing protein n=1 Tax=Methylotenera sp. TaxID=2051956 RepID=UPI002487F468|nr:LPD7 domain-containing protein [Methylotenera sp.]MDI1308440.1 hypothetical protein [Methylotenera sp.]
MLIRISGGKDGIEDYLINGKKAGREFSRDELDERVFLHGGLSLTNSIIQSMETKHEKYLHITLSFREDKVDEKDLQQIVKDFQAFAFSSFGNDEFNFYAEAHLPKIKSYIDKSTGEEVFRKPHIHIVIPKTNLMSGLGLDPFPPVRKKLPNGKWIVVDQKTAFTDAWQEFTNAKYGLQSPKDHPRVNFTDKSEIIGREKGDLFGQQRRDLQSFFLDQVLEREIESWAEFEKMLGEHGQAREVKGRYATYMHFQPETGKGINLKRVFTQEFIALPTAEKLKRLAPELQKSYVTQSTARREPDHIAGTLAYWHSIKAREIKYINSGSRKRYAEYKAADDAGKIVILDQLETKFYEKHKAEVAPVTPSFTPDLSKLTQQQLQKGIAHVTGTGTTSHYSDYITNFEHAPRGSPPQRRGGLYELSYVSMDGDGQVSDRVLQDTIYNRVGNQQPGQGQDMRHTIPTGGSRSGSVVDQSLNELHKAKQINAASKESRTQKIKRELNAQLLLDALVESHGLVAEKYTISKGADGGDRILAGKQNLNVSDFLTREMHMPWAEASKILNDVYITQDKTNATLWEQFKVFNAAQKIEYKTTREKTSPYRALQVTKNKEELATLNESKKQNSNALWQKYRNDPVALQREKTLLIKAHLDAKATLQERQKLDLEQFKLPKALDYTEWLKAQELSREHQLALDKANKTKAEKEEESDFSIRGIKTKNITIDIRDFKAETNPLSGNVRLMNQKGELAFVVTADRINVILQRDTESVLAALQLGAAKYGKLNITGDDEFQKLCVELAAQHGFKFVDEKLNDQVKAIRDERNKITATKPKQEPAAAAAPNPTKVQSTADVELAEEVLSTTVSKELAPVLQSLAELLASKQYQSIDGKFMPIADTANGKVVEHVHTSDGIYTVVNVGRGTYNLVKGTHGVIGVTSDIKKGIEIVKKEKDGRGR